MTDPGHKTFLFRFGHLIRLDAGNLCEGILKALASNRTEPDGKCRGMAGLILLLDSIMPYYTTRLDHERSIK